MQVPTIRSSDRGQGTGQGAPACAGESFVWNDNSVVHDVTLRLPHGAAARQEFPPHGADRNSGSVLAVRVTGKNQAAELARILAAARLGNEFAVVNGDDASALAASGPARPPAFGGEKVFRCMSSGSSGNARTVRRTHQSWVQSFRINQRRWDIGAADVYAVLGELCHSLTLYGALEAVHLGADLHLICGLRPDRQLRALAERKVTVLYATPTQIRLLAASTPRGSSGPATSVRLALVGGSKLDECTRQSAAELFPNASIHEFYGSSETSFVAISDRETPAESVGRAYPGVEIRIGPGKQHDAAGEIWISSPYLFAGYCGEPGGARWDGRFLSVGEVGQLDGNGHLHLTGRIDRMVKVADRIIHPETIENCLLQLEGVQHAAVLPEPDPLRGNVLVAFVKLSDGTIDPDGLGNKCRIAVGPLATPRRFIIRESWPVLPSGKTDRPALAAFLEAMAD